MKKNIHIILISLFTFTIISCAKESGSSSSSTATTMSTPSIADGNYKLTALSVIIYNSDGSNYGSGTFQVNHSSSVTPGYLGYGMSWQGSGVYRITVFGKATISNNDLGNETLDCTTNSIKDTTLDTNGKMTAETIIQTGCGGGVLELTLESDTYSAITGGMTKVVVASNSSYRYQYTYTFLKQNTTSSYSTAELEGTWKSSCVSSGSRYKIRTFTVSGTNVTEKWEYHSDSSCANDEYSYDSTYSSLSIGDALTFDTYGSSGGSGHKLTMTIDTNTYTPLSASDVTWNNSNSWCGETDWVLNTPQSIAGKTCGSYTKWNTNITIYGVYALDGSTLYLGLSSGSYPSTVTISDNNSQTKQ